MKSYYKKQSMVAICLFSVFFFSVASAERVQVTRYHKNTARFLISKQTLDLTVPKNVTSYLTVLHRRYEYWDLKTNFSTIARVMSRNENNKVLLERGFGTNTAPGGDIWTIGSNSSKSRELAVYIYPTDTSNGLGETKICLQTYNKCVVE